MTHTITPTRGAAGASSSTGTPRGRSTAARIPRANPTTPAAPAAPVVSQPVIETVLVSDCGWPTDASAPSKTTRRR